MSTAFRIGRDWYVPDFNSPKEAIDYGTNASRVLMDWNRIEMRQD